jgi:3-oxoacyl-[acyl-carrier-protein] synthase III
MSFPRVHLSRPSVVLPELRIDNEEVVRRIRENYRGKPEQWRIVEESVRYVFARSNTHVRYFEPDPKVRVGEFASRAAIACLEANEMLADDVDLLIYGGIARNYFEPATAMEVAARCGIQGCHAFDITSACVGLLESVHVASAYLGMHPEIRTALVCSAELTHQFISFDIQTPADLLRKAAGLTIGNAAAAFLVRREPFAEGSLRLLAMQNMAIPKHYDLCKAPIDGPFDSLSTELMRLNVHAPPELSKLFERVGWKPAEIDHFVFHQPGDAVVLETAAVMGLDPHKVVLTHSIYGNTATTTVPLALDHLLKERRVLHDDKIVFSSAAAGFTMVSGAGVWVD